ncbi:MAG TPA: NADP-dependent oxidoreductase [Gaiellaceae bacterium]|nr:NADP-dependent oxidoreductase [Gaiellaceae bacterium]
MTREVVLAAVPQGMPRESDFEVRDAPDAEPGDGELLVRNVFVSVDPYMRGRMTGVRTYVAPFAPGDVIDGGAVGQVVASRADGFAEGDWVQTMLGWRDAGVVPAATANKLDPELAPVSTALGVLGMPGLTAWVGLVDIGRIEPGETVYVSGAAGAVGSAAVQIAKLKGCRAIGSAGSDEKVEWLRSLGVEAFNYKTAQLDEKIDVYFDNVGGDQLEIALSRLNTFGRVVACGAISRYNDPAGPSGPRNMGFVVTKRLRLQGFIVTDHFDRLPAFLAEVGPWVANGELQYRETIVDGLENAPKAFAGLFTGLNTGKLLVRVV